MKFIADHLMQFTDSRDTDLCCLQKSIAALNRRIGWVPKGWVPIYQNMVKSLVSLKDDVHEDATIVGPWIEDAKMEFTSRNLTPVLAGILRKTMQRSLCTCKKCGLPGKLRNFGEEAQQVLCARCFAPRELVDQLAKWIPRLQSADFLESESVIVVDDLEPAFLALIPESQWRWLSDGSDGDALPYLLSKDVADLLPELKNLQTLVMEMATADE